MSTIFPHPLHYTRRCGYVLQGYSRQLPGRYSTHSEVQHPRTPLPSLLERIQIFPSHFLNYQDIASFRQWQLLTNIMLGYCLNSNSRSTCQKES